MGGELSYSENSEIQGCLKSRFQCFIATFLNIMFKDIFPAVHAKILEMKMIENISKLSITIMKYLR